MLRSVIYLIGLDFFRVFAKSLYNLSGAHGPPFLIAVLVYSNQLLYINTCKNVYMCVCAKHVCVGGGGGVLLKCYFSQVY